MNQIEVPDWVAAVALDAYKASRGSYEGEVPPDHDDMKAALRAALSAWVVQQHQCMCTDEDEVPNGPRDIWMDVSADDYPKLTARNDVRGRTLYTFRQEKPE